MAEFSVKTNAVRTTLDAEEGLRRELDSIQEIVREVSGSLAIKSAAAPDIKRRLGSLAGRVEGHRESMGSMENALERAAGLYEETEKKICGNTEGRVKTGKSQVLKTGKIGSAQWSDLGDLYEKKGIKVGAVASFFGTSIMAIWSEILRIFRKLKEIIGLGDVTDEQPIAGWSGEENGGAAAGNTSEGGSAGSGVTADDTAQMIADLKAREGTVVADINGENYYSNKNISYAGGYHNYKGVPQCTWYAYGRFMEVTGIALYSAHDAYTWLDNNVNDSRVKVTYGGETIQWPAIAVQPPNPNSDVGHVMFVEGVEYNADGTPAYVYITEANNSTVRPDGKLQRLSYEEFKGKGEISGYISAV